MSFGTHNKALTFLNFNNAGSLGEDVSGLGKNVTPVALTQATIGGVTNAVLFSPASDSGILLDNIIDDYHDSVSLSFSAKVRWTSAVGVQCIFSASDSSHGSSDFILFSNGTTIQFQIRLNGATQFSISSAAAVVVDTWYHVAFSTGPNGAKLWMNNVSKGTNASTASMATIPNINGSRLGFNVDSGGREYEFSGYLKDVFLSAAEINDSTVADIYANDIYSYKVISLLGQSNRIGRSLIASGIDDDYSIVSGKVFQWGLTAQSRSAATNPLDHDGETAGSMGSWLAMCNEIVPSLAYKQAVMLVPAARGATGFAFHWNPGNAIYEAALASHNAAMSYHTYSDLEAVTWLQGETDADNSNFDYLADLEAMYDDFDARATGFSTSVPFIATEISGSTIPANVDFINAALASFVSAGTERYLIENTGLSIYDTYHYTSASQRTIGTREAAALGFAVDPEIFFTVGGGNVEFAGNSVNVSFLPASFSVGVGNVEFVGNSISLEILSPPSLFTIANGDVEFSGNSISLEILGAASAFSIGAGSVEFAGNSISLEIAGSPSEFGIGTGAVEFSGNSILFSEAEGPIEFTISNAIVEFSPNRILIDYNDRVFITTYTVNWV